ncbi:HlyD family type I secretion periplasmic adaptor subunit [Jejubacter calystegiae]|uniref:Membrane fusion protein (MFP) family protein n=1 Tax=Jejubacter calystegiae TaxID=2579935 RepID=A0A4V1G7D9_9ENTR|nr:HlyD family type I secretion periplasmic adaptor subunit [Jejubacter calystegiae]QCT19307.1 HlyD family type I secretion periplasmic adaptor subunit [Jejubacter calystegiae]
MEQKKTPFIAPEETSNAGGNNERFYQLMGIAVIIIGIMGFFSWAAFAPLDKGVTASGTVIVAGNRKAVQAPSNGIVESIRIKEGDRIQAGVTLIELSRTPSQARYEQARDKYLAALAATARLQAERDNLATPVYPDTLLEDRWRPQGEAAIALQNQLFHARRQAMLGELNSNQHSLTSLELQTQSLSRALNLKKRMNNNLIQQLHDTKSLAEQGIFPLNRYRELQRQQHETQSQIEELTGQIASNKEKQKGIKQNIERSQGEYYRDVNTLLEKSTAESNEQQKNIQITHYELEHTQIVAPISGTIMALKVMTPDSVLSSGETLMEIVPDDLPLVVDAQVNSDLIDKVYPGLEVNMMFTALNQNKTPVIPGHVSLVSPDRLINKNNGEPYYQVQITVSDEGMELLKNEDIRPGMSAGVLIKTGSRSLLNYLFKPVLDRAKTALTEE